MAVEMDKPEITCAYWILIFFSLLLILSLKHIAVTVLLSLPFNRMKLQITSKASESQILNSEGFKSHP